MISDTAYYSLLLHSFQAFSLTLLHLKLSQSCERQFRNALKYLTKNSNGLSSVVRSLDNVITG